MKVQLNPAQIGISFVIFALALYPSFLNYKYNDHSKNWLNHDYGKNLLSSTEEYSVFMTEGGDNQVFSSLYFTYAEKLRQDLFPYDQKGNIFKRIYGDLRYVTSDILEERSTIVNKGLFTGQEPFYTDIRSHRKPYLVPYALGRPSTYLTWRLPNQHILGDFYYKNYGLMYKVQEIRFAIVDYVKTLKTASNDEIIIYLQEKLDRPIDSDEYNYWVSLLVQDGFITRGNHSITFIKDYPKPFKKDPSETFIRRWNDIPNIAHFDYLSREIVISFSYEQIMFLSDAIEELQRLSTYEESSSSRKEIDQQIQEHWTQIQEYIALVKEVGYDSSATLHNIGVFYLTAPEKFEFIDDDFGMFEEAIALWEKSLESAPYAWSTYNVLLWGYIRQSFVYTDRAEHYLQSFDEIVDTMFKNIKHWKSMQNVERSRPYQQVSQLIQLRDQYYQISGGQLLEERRAFTSMANGTAPLQINTLQSYVSKMINQLSFISGTQVADEFFDSWVALWQRYQSNREFFDWQITLLGEIGSYHSIMDERVILTTIKDAPKYLPSFEDTTERDIQLFINLVKISLSTDDLQAISNYKTLLLQRAKKVLTPQQYESIRQQVAQL